MEHAPSISVVMPVYNAEPYVADAIRSILTQSLEDFEFIIIDNGSTDGSSQIIRSFTDPRIRVVTNPVNVGPPPALNQGLRLANGKYVARMDADDITLPGRLAKQWAFMEEHPRCAAVGTQAVLIDAMGQSMYEPWCPTMMDAIRWRLLFSSPFVHSSVMMRREMVLEVGGYNESLRHAADYALWSRLLREGYEIANLPETLTQLRIHEHSDGMTARQGPELLEEMAFVSQSNIQALLHINISREQILMLKTLLSRAKAPTEATEAIDLLHMISRTFGPRGRPFYGLTILSIALSERLRTTTRIRLMVSGVVALLSFGQGLDGYRFIWREWVVSGRLLSRIRFELRRPHPNTGAAR